MEERLLEAFGSMIDTSQLWVSLRLMVHNKIVSPVASLVWIIVYYDVVCLGVFCSTLNQSTALGLEGTFLEPYNFEVVRLFWSSVVVIKYNMEYMVSSFVLLVVLYTPPHALTVLRLL